MPGKAPEPTFDVGETLILVLKEEVRLALNRFSVTPPGRVVKIVGTKIVQARKEGRQLTPEEIQALAEAIPNIMRGGEDPKP